jgi:hypothetical protein
MHNTAAKVNRYNYICYGAGSVMIRTGIPLMAIISLVEDMHFKIELNLQLK